MSNTDLMPAGDYAAGSDEMLPEHRIYANAVNGAVKKYNQAVKKAAAERDETIQEAMRVCQEVLRTRADNGYYVKPPDA